LPGEKIDYNERFWWTWDQGRFGFGPYGKFCLLTETLNILTEIVSENIMQNWCHLMKTLELLSKLHFTRLLQLCIYLTEGK
jgi:hypothetical protein